MYLILFEQKLDMEPSASIARSAQQMTIVESGSRPSLPLLPWWWLALSNKNVRSWHRSCYNSWSALFCPVHLVSLFLEEDQLLGL